MILKSSYIFLKQPYKAEENKKQITPEADREEMNIAALTGESIYCYLLKAFSEAEKDEDAENFYCNKLSCSLEVKGDNFCVTFVIKDVGDVTYMDIFVNGEGRAKTVNAMEEICERLYATGIREDYVDIVSYDSVSEYYCNKMFVKLNTLERNLRNLLFNIYVLNFGEEYYTVTMSEELQLKIKGVIGSDNSKDYQREVRRDYKVNADRARDIIRLQQFFYSFEFSDIQQLLFTPAFTKLNERSLEEFLSGHRDLSGLGDEELRRAFEDFKPKSDWSRFFSDKIKLPEIEEMIDTLRRYRNSVAHFKFFDREDYQNCGKLIAKLNKAILEAIKLTEERDFVLKNKEEMKKSLEGLSNNISKTLFSMKAAAASFVAGETLQKLKKSTED